jgi:hypothetical protein
MASAAVLGYMAPAAAVLGNMAVLLIWGKHI